MRGALGPVLGLADSIGRLDASIADFCSEFEGGIAEDCSEDLHPEVGGSMDIVLRRDFRE